MRTIVQLNLDNRGHFPEKYSSCQSRSNSKKCIITHYPIGDAHCNGITIYETRRSYKLHVTYIWMVIGRPVWISGQLICAQKSAYFPHPRITHPFSLLV